MSRVLDVTILMLYGVLPLRLKPVQSRLPYCRLSTQSLMAEAYLIESKMKARLGGHLLVLTNVVVHLSLPWVTLQTLVSLCGGNGEALRAFLPRLRPFSKEAYICLVLLSI